MGLIVVVACGLLLLARPLPWSPRKAANNKDDDTWTQLGPTTAAAATTSLSSTTSHTIFVQFDGSLRHPTDPGVPTASLGRMAACAASLTVVTTTTTTSEESKKTNQSSCRVRLGGKILSASSVTSSGAVEYEGLLLGLQGLELYFQERQKHCSDSSSSSNIQHIRIQGDCKTVVEQMSQTARPRKLREYHQRAVSIIDKLALLLEQQEGSKSTRSRGRGRGRGDATSSCLERSWFSFEHIPRADNVVCDRIAARLLCDQQQTALDRVWSNNNIRPNNNNNTMNTVSRCSDFDDDFSLIPYSQRPSIYQYLASMAVGSGDWRTVLSVGEQLQREVEVVWNHYFTTTTTTVVPDNRLLLPMLWNSSNLDSSHDDVASSSSTSRTPSLVELLLLEALVYQRIALNKLGRAKESRILQRRKHFLWSKYSSQVTCIEQRLASAAAGGRVAPRPATMNDERSETLWPIQVLEWYHEIQQPSSTTARWREHDTALWGTWKDIPNA